MTETSGLWTTDATPAGHEVASYTQAIASDMLKITAACSGFEGVAPGYESELAPSTTGAFNVRIAAGGAMVDGKFYKNTANVDKTLDTPTAGTTRIDRVVVEATWATPDCVITVIKGTESGGSPSAPAIPSTAGTNYAIQICQALVNNAGDVTITDERKWAIVDTDESTLEDSAGLLRVKALGIGTAQIAADAVTTAKIPNRTRKIFVPCIGARNTTDNTDLERSTAVGYTMDIADLCTAFGNFVVPQDFASAMTVVPLWYSISGAGTGDIYYKTDVYYGASGEAWNTHGSAASYAALAVNVDQWQAGASTSLSSAAIDDIVSLRFYRDATSGSDTFNGPHYILGFLVSYTADS